MNQPPVMDYLVITASGADQVGLVDRLTARILDAGCNIVESRMALLGGQFAMILLLSGRWDALSKLEDRLPAIGEDLGLAIIHKRTRPPERKQPLVPYHIEVVAIDHPGIVHSLASYFARQGINIEELNTETYPAPHTGTPMFSVNMTVGVPANMHIPTLRGDFLDYCDSLNLDAVFEPVRA
ncbi:MAG: glycine cleavage system protein R [Thiobacillaceae bacterium]|nr:glycine cleavage system protein R [Thiobacillaceae bacterium]MCX7672051.1 glycine cleavage system protein R [Thiobacillaceae bacterium]MDW8323815.1 glycine cleavage system protein R [Burkholderiales bacterium]